MWPLAKQIANEFMLHIYDQHPREIPTKKDPNIPTPEKAPDLEPGKDNPRNPQDDDQMI